MCVGSHLAVYRKYKSSSISLLISPSLAPFSPVSALVYPESKYIKDICRNCLVTLTG